MEVLIRLCIIIGAAVMIIMAATAIVCMVSKIDMLIRNFICLKFHKTIPRFIKKEIPFTNSVVRLYWLECQECDRFIKNIDAKEYRELTELDDKAK